jgi:hypothetical protein
VLRSARLILQLLPRYMEIGINVLKGCGQILENQCNTATAVLIVLLQYCGCREKFLVRLECIPSILIQLDVFATFERWRRWLPHAGDDEIRYYVYPCR